MIGDPIRHGEIGREENGEPNVVHRTQATTLPGNGVRLRLEAARTNQVVRVRIVV